MNKKILFVVNNLGFFMSHRLKIGTSLHKIGCDVYVAYGEIGYANINSLIADGITPIAIPMSRGFSNLTRELLTFYELFQLFRRLRPDMLHLVTIKPYLYGGIVARLTNLPSVVIAVAGLGTAFTSRDFKSKILRIMLYPLFYFAFGHKNQKVIVQNEQDKSVLLNWRVLDKNKVKLLHGSGVDLNEFKHTEEPSGVPVVTFAARLLHDKGVLVFIEAIRLLVARGLQARYLLVGDVDLGNPGSVTREELEVWRSEGLVDVLGYSTNIPAIYSMSNIVCLPSYYGEGLPKSLLEAAAAGRAVVTTDHPGCRDAVRPNITGLLVPVKNPEKLADTLQFLIQYPEKRKRMGVAGRKLAEREFSVEIIVREHMKIYNELFASC